MKYEPFWSKAEMREDPITGGQEMIGYINVALKPKERARTTYHKSGKIATHTPMDTKEATECLHHTLKELVLKCNAPYPISEDYSKAVSIELLIHPKRADTSKINPYYPYTRGDIDNYEKLFLDACIGVFFNNDQFVRENYKRVAYAEKDRKDFTGYTFIVRTVEYKKDGDPFYNAVIEIPE